MEVGTMTHSPDALARARSEAARAVGLGQAVAADHGRVLLDEIDRLTGERDALRDVARRLRGGWKADIPCLGPEVWCWFHPVHDPELMTSAERAVLDRLDDKEHSDVG
jgi:hypothetical protein